MLSCLLNGERINCCDGNYGKEQLKKWAAKKILLCPACGKPYEYCHGKVKSPYFRHMDKVECEDNYSEPETEEHITGKKDLYDWVRKQPGVTDCELEGWIPATKQRPDIMFKYYGKQYVLEYQCSPISTEYYERHELYQAAGIKDIWVLGTDKYFHKNENKKSAKFRKKEIEKCTNYYYDSESKLFISRQDIDYRVSSFCISYNYSNPNNRVFNDLLRFMDNTYVVCRLNYMNFSTNGFILGEEIRLFEKDVIQKYITTKSILSYAKKYLNKRYKFLFYDDRYNENCIEINRLCFSIDIKRKTYRCFEKYFTYSWRGHRKWECNERNINCEKVDKITWNSFIVFVISILMKCPDYKQAIVNS